MPDLETALGSRFITSSPSAGAAENELSTAATKATKTADRDPVMLSSWTTSYHRARFAVDLLLNFNTRFAQSEKVSVRRALTTLPRLHVVAAVATRVLSVLTRSIIILVR